MNISSLSIQDKRKLSELLEDLIDILNRKDSLIENASKEIDRMNAIDDMQSKLDEKGSELTSIATPIDAKELQNLVEKSDKLSSERAEINIKSRRINEDLSNLEDIERSLMDKINNILFLNKEKDEDKGLYIDSMNTNVYIIDKQITDSKDIINPDNCEIINCNINLIVEIVKLYRSNINKIILETDESGFDELKEKVQKYKNDKNSSYDKQLELLRNSFNTQEEKENKEELIQPINIEDSKEETKETNNNLVDLNEQIAPSEIVEQMPIVNEEVINSEPIDQIIEEPKQDDNVVPLSTLLDQQLAQPLDIPVVDNQINKENAIKYITINSDDKVVPNKMVRATKEKLNNKIIDICWGSFEPRKFEYISSKNDSLTNFNLNDFVNNKAA